MGVYIKLQSKGKNNHSCHVLMRAHMSDQFGSHAKWYTDAQEDATDPEQSLENLQDKKKAKKCANEWQRGM